MDKTEVAKVGLPASE